MVSLADTTRELQDDESGEPVRPILGSGVLAQHHGFTDSFFDGPDPGDEPYVVGSIEPPKERYGVPGLRMTAMDIATLATAGSHPAFSRSPLPVPNARTTAVEYPGTIGTTEYATRHKLTPKEVRQQIATGVLPAIRTGRGRGNMWRIPVEAVTA